MKNKYRFNNTEEKTNRNKSIFFVVLTLGLIAALYFVGIPLLIKVTSFVGDFGKPGNKVEFNDSVPPGPPNFDSLPNATNNPRLTIKGRSEPGSEVEISLNNSKETVTSDEEGGFSITLDLEKGENIISATAKDSAGNIGHPSDTVKVIFDNIVPNLDVTLPADGAEFTGASQRQISIQGKTESGAGLTVNGRFVNVLEDGSFSYSTTLSEGENKFEIKVKDTAENTAEKTLTVTFSL